MVVEIPEQKREEVFSFYNHKVTNPTPSDRITTPQLLEMIKGETYKEDIIKIRSLKSKDDQRDAKKNSLPYVTIGGIFSYRNDDCLISLSGLMCIDIDGLATPVEVQKQKEKMKLNKYVHACFTSPSGLGLKIIVRIPKDKEDYPRFFVAFYDEFTGINAVQFDTRTRDISHACFLSYDPFPHYNPDSEIFDKKKEIDKLSPSNDLWEQIDSCLNVDKSRSGYEYREVVKLIRTGNSKEEIFNLAKSFADQSVVWGQNIDGENVIAWEKWNRGGGHYREVTYNKALEYCKSHPVTDRPRVKLPEGLSSSVSRTIGEFAKDMGSILSSKYQLFFNVALKKAVEIRWIHDKQDTNIFYLGFVQLNGDRFVTLVEKDIIVYTTIRKEIKDKDGKVTGVKTKDVEKNMTLNQANLTIVSDQFVNQLPRIRRIFTAPIPILYQGELTFPKKGYDPRFESWLDPTAPELEEVGYDEAIVTIKYLFAEFCFKDMKQDKTHSISALLTPFLRGLYGAFNDRTPLFIYLANRERAGKDFCAGITGIVYEGVAREDTPLSDAGDSKFNNSTKSDELRKKICSAMISGRKRMHFSNCKGHLDNTILEQIITNKSFADRLLGKNEELIMDNEMDFSLSGNLGISYTPDVEQRSRVIHFTLNMEDPNNRKFNNPNLHEWVLKNRNKILGSLFALVKRWYDEGMPSGKTPFASFPNWARVCGGIMMINGLGDPCLNQKSLVTGGNSIDKDMKLLWEIGCETYKGYKDGFLKSELMDFLSGVNGICATEGLFSNFAGLCEETKNKQMGSRVAFSKEFINHIGREFSNIKLVLINSEEQKESRRRYKFIKENEEEIVE